MAATRGFVAVRVMHGLTMKRRAVFHRMGAPFWKRPMIAVAIVEMMIDVAVEMIVPVVPGSSTDEDST